MSSYVSRKSNKVDDRKAKWTNSMSRSNGDGGRSSGRSTRHRSNNGTTNNSSSNSFKRDSSQARESGRNRDNGRDNGRRINTNSKSTTPNPFMDTNAINPFTTTNSINPFIDTNHVMNPFIGTNTGHSPSKRLQGQGQGGRWKDINSESAASSASAFAAAKKKYMESQSQRQQQRFQELWNVQGANSKPTTNNQGNRDDGRVLRAGTMGRGVQDGYSNSNNDNDNLQSLLTIHEFMKPNPETPSLHPMDKLKNESKLFGDQIVKILNSGPINGNGLTIPEFTPLLRESDLSVIWDNEEKNRSKENKMKSTSTCSGARNYSSFLGSYNSSTLSRMNGETKYDNGCGFGSFLVTNSHLNPFMPVLPRIPKPNDENLFKKDNQDSCVSNSSSKDVVRENSCEKEDESELEVVEAEENDNEKNSVSMCKWTSDAHESSWISGSILDSSDDSDDDIVQKKQKSKKNVVPF